MINSNVSYVLHTRGEHVGRKFYDEIIKNGGASIDAKSLEFYNDLAYGYAVGGEEIDGAATSKVLALSQFTESDAIQFVAYAHTLIDGANRDYIIGGWVHNGAVYLELSSFYEDKETALRIAEDRGEKAIYSFAYQEDITV